MNHQTTKNFMQRCKKERGFTFIYPYFIRKPLDLNFVESAIYNIRCDFPGAFNTVKHFVKFLFEMKTCIENVLGSDYKVEVYKHAFELCEGDEMINLDHIEQSVAVKLTSKCCCSTTVKIYSLWESV